MPARPNTDGALGTALDGPTLNMAYILRMDIVGDPVFAWTGFGDLSFVDTYGSNLVSPATTATGDTTTGIVNTYGSAQAISTVSGRLRLTSSGANQTAPFGINMTVTIGKTYRLRGAMYPGTGTKAQLGRMRNTGEGQTFYNYVANLDVTFTATYSEFVLLIRGVDSGGAGLNVGEFVEFDNLELTEVISNQTGDAALDGQTFGGITHLVAEISSVEDSQGGSGAIEITLPGVDLTDEAMRQVVYDRRKWQFKPAWLWLAFFDEAGALIGKPIRLRSGRMDQMVVEETDGEGVVRCTIESQQAYASEASATRYSEQAEVDPADTSQKYVWQLANINPQIGQRFGLASSGGGGGSGGNSGGGSRMGLFNNVRNV